MSPALLTKYLDAANDIANHAVLLPAGMRFSASTSAQDGTDEALAKIRAFYARYTWQGGAEALDLQGVKFDTNTGGDGWMWRGIWKPCRAGEMYLC